MRKAVISSLFLLAPSFLFSQSFSLTDTHFRANCFCRTYNILFDLSKTTIRRESFSHLDSVAAFLTANPTLKIEIGVHTDSRISKASSTRLSMSRANGIRDYFVSKGISSDRLMPKGYDDQKLLITDTEISKLKSNDEKEAAHQKNRRVEYKIIASDGPPFTLNDSVFAIGGYYRTYRITFDFSKAGLTVQGYPLLDSISDFMKKFPYLEFEIGAHTDHRGSADANLKLSEDRAKTVKDYIAGKGVDAKRMTTVGYGETKLLVPESVTQKITHGEAEILHAQNRRIEFIIKAI